MCPERLSWFRFIYSDRYTCDRYTTLRVGIIHVVGSVSGRSVVLRGLLPFIYIIHGGDNLHRVETSVAFSDMYSVPPVGTVAIADGV